ncbi:methylated-DNA--[protein]-cysteine S-methyltransferase [Candidatus Bathyarchaeota archaeon]|nr:methylated-DNA--[protein]-cysteine S-methyltransferase [Candidatus Bathyarchaeota archaeon]
MISLYIENVEGVWFGIACDEKKIFATTFASDEKRVLQSLLKSIPFNVSFQHSEITSVFARRVIGLMKNIYDGKGGSDSFSLVTEYLSDYARRVIEVVSLIPVGYVASYGSVARAAGGGPRAVGRVMASNPFPLVVPCHRVVCSDFTLGGYGGGYDNVPVKLGILRRESRGYTSEREISVANGKLLVFPVERVLKRVGEE